MVVRLTGTGGEMERNPYQLPPPPPPLDFAPAVGAAVLTPPCCCWAQKLVYHPWIEARSLGFVHAPSQTPVGPAEKAVNRGSAQKHPAMLLEDPTAQAPFTS